jgi:hypothetical protein
MKRHIFGLAIFSFIVGAALISYRLFYVPDNPPLSCWIVKSVQQNSNDGVTIKQAIFNVNTEVLTFEPTANGNLPIELHFFTKNGNDTHYVGSFYSLKSLKTNGVRSCIKCLENLESYENLYVMAENTSWTEHQNDLRHPKFDVNKATSILLDYGK